MPLCIEIVLDYEAIPAETVWKILRSSHPALLPATKRVDFFGTWHTVSDMPKAIIKKGKDYFSACFDEGELRYSSLGTEDLSLIFIIDCVYNWDDAWDWIKPFSLLDEFRSAIVHDKEYEHWQNAEDPLQYTAVGRSYAHLPMKSNEAPYPLEQMIIDTSRNPGRRIFCQGYIEAIGAVMWLGKQFWKLTGACKQEVLAQKWLKCDELPHGVLRVQAADEPFTTAEGPAGEVQNKLRALLFPESR